MSRCLAVLRLRAFVLFGLVWGVRAAAVGAAVGTRGVAGAALGFCGVKNELMVAWVRWVTSILRGVAKWRGQN